MIQIRNKHTIILGLTVVLFAVTGLIPTIIAGRPGGGGGTESRIVYPCQYSMNGHIISDDIDHFRSIDGQIIHWYDGWALSTTIWFLRPSSGATKGNSVQMKLKFSASGPYVLNMRIYYYNGYNELWSYIGPENVWTLALATIPNYRSVDFIVFATLGGVTNLDIDYLAACYPNVDLGIEPVNFFLIESIPGPFPDW